MANRPRRLLIGEGAGIGATLLLVEQLRAQLEGHTAAEVAHGTPLAVPSASAVPLLPLVLLGSNTAFPFRPRPSVIVVPGIPTGVIACMPLLEEWGIASRLASTADLPGCFEGTVTALADAWLSSLTPADLADVEIFARGPTPTLDAASTLARHYNVPCQTSDPT